MKRHYVMPLKWSLYYCMTKREWAEFREAVTSYTHSWDKCSCPGRCRATALDENWDYDREKHVKMFRSARFICPGCHWLKSPSFRVSTWMRQIRGELPAPVGPPHIVSCLGWSRDMVNQLRKRDLERHFREEEALASSVLEHRQARLRFLPYDVDLSRLQGYGYSRALIVALEMRMQIIALRRIDDLQEVSSRHVLGVPSELA